MTREERIEQLALKDIASRREAMKNILEAEGLEFTIQETPGSYKNPLGVVNYVLTPANDEPSLLFSAHYDAVAGSSGANDNAASVCLLIDLAKDLAAKGINARFVFFDGEETKLAGSKYYLSQIDRSLILGAINLDLCGFGDTMTIYPHGKKVDSTLQLEPFIRKSIYDNYNGQIVNYLPKSDDYSFASVKIPVLGISVMPHSDVMYLKALATYNDGMLGHPPEYDMMIDQMEISTTMHGGYRDDVKWLEPETMNRVHDFLLDAVTTIPEKRKKLLGFRIG